MPLSNSNNINILATKLSNIDLTESLKWSLIPKSELGDDLISLEPFSANSSSGCVSATLEMENIMKLVHQYSTSNLSKLSEPVHPTTPNTDMKIYDKQKPDK
jgi:hypothetical protein